tara:strand:- start:911 stop:1534 length:624 start_codon:yes stop_codon:yes gene_type:complete
MATVGSLLLNSDILDSLDKIQEAVDEEQQKSKNRSIGSLVGQYALPFIIDLALPGVGSAIKGLTTAQQLGTTFGLSYAGSKIGESLAGSGPDTERIKSLSKSLRFGTDEGLKAAEAIEKTESDRKTQQLLSAGTTALTSKAGMDILKDLPMFKTAIGDKLKFPKTVNTDFGSKDIDIILKGIEEAENFDPLDPIYLALKKAQEDKGI